jgi:hypothetical protein
MAEFGPSMFGGLSGQMSVSQSMFGDLGPKVAPDPAEMEAQRERVMYSKHVKCKGQHVKIFDMHVPKQVKEYEKLYPVLFLGLQSGTHKMMANERALIKTEKGERWFRYLEWMEFELEVAATPPVGAAS